jgi:hypothetical protein
MALMLSRLYDALRLANVPEDKAREAAEEVATYEQVKTDTYVLKWMVGVPIAIVLGVFWMQWQMVGRMAGVEAGLVSIQANLTDMRGHFEERFTGVEGRLSGVESRLSNVATGLTSVDDRLGQVGKRLDAIDARRSQP